MRSAVARKYFGKKSRKRRNLSTVYRKEDQEQDTKRGFTLQDVRKTIGQESHGPANDPEDDNEYVYGHLDKETDKKDEPTWRCHQNLNARRTILLLGYH